MSKLLDDNFDFRTIMREPTKIEPLPDQLEPKPEFSYPKMFLTRHEYLTAPASSFAKDLGKLADYLLSLPSNYSDFSMDTWQGYTHKVNNRPLVTGCGTIACAAGHGPSAGIPGIADERWASYALRLACNNRNASNFFFDVDWACYDNTPHGAAHRIKYTLKNGVPLSLTASGMRRRWVEYKKWHRL